MESEPDRTETADTPRQPVHRLVTDAGRSVRDLFAVAHEAAREWLEDKTSIFAAALAYHALLALAPLVIVAVGLIGLIYGQSIVTELSALAEEHLSPATVDVIELILDSWSPSAGTNTLAIVIGVAFMLFGAAGAFRSIRRALNAMWGIEPVPVDLKIHSVARVLFNQLLMVLLVLALALAIAALVIVSAAWSWLTGRITASVSGGETLLRVGDVVASFGITTLVIALLYLVVPMGTVHRSDRWSGALAAALLFTVGKEAFGVYMSHSSTASAYGAAGALVVFLIWVYYSAWIVYYGAEIAKVRGRRHGRDVKPRAGARRIMPR